MKKRAGYFSYSDGRKFKGLSLHEIFSQINREKFWQYEIRHDSVSGPGSIPDQTVELVNKLPRIMDAYQMNSILDIPCGDFNWMKLIDWKGRKYIGADILEDLIRINSGGSREENISFQVLDLTADALPAVDLVFCRDCLVHLSFNDIFRSLANIKRSHSRFIMITTFPDEEANEDIPSGGWRPLNLNLPPFNFPKPLYLLNEHCTEADGLFADKSLGLWEIAGMDG
jgi:SAM-dependent methyltransferase